ncbi:hypothetical protein EJ06DRAFT_497110 [Trichodelitschia bisporula]|uniref:Mitochondrial zinc maintenance protein 1, mitochondrial n=1 Tax=Trichodelitschia bisporula TaxID=703511 RepID=A0A6G1HR97_9PEZI|nr:hypothetical protein EJ06DRAFT_497110 [Trichodelitschia bisporula]
MALAAYRHVLRSARIAFQDDLSTLKAAQRAARDGFEKYRHESSDKAAEHIHHAEDVAKILRENIVQGRAVGDQHFKLRIHEHTERGDNETVKTAVQKGQPAGNFKCCSA